VPPRPSIAAALAIAALAGCGGSTAGDKPAPDTPVGAVQGLIAGIKDGDTEEACKRLSNEGADLFRVIKLDKDELDEFGLTKDCQVTLERHAKEALKLVRGAAPKKVTKELPNATITDEDQAVVSSRKGDWLVTNENVRADTSRWVVARFPGQKTPEP
jgi:hypothetical protein